MIQNFADWLVFSIIGLDNETALGSAVNFFLTLTMRHPTERILS